MSITLNFLFAHRNIIIKQNLFPMHFYKMLDIQNTAEMFFDNYFLQ